MWKPFIFESSEVKDDERNSLNRYIQSRRAYFGGIDEDFDSILDCAQRNLYSSNPRKLRRMIDWAFRKYRDALVE